MNSITLRKEMEKKGVNLATADCLEERQLAFERALQIVIPPRDQSDRTSFRNIGKWLAEGCLGNKFNEHVIFRRVLDFALEVSAPSSRKTSSRIHLNFEKGTWLQKKGE